jgi:hypothetical protein
MIETAAICVFCAIVSKADREVKCCPRDLHASSRGSPAACATRGAEKGRKLYFAAWSTSHSIVAFDNTSAAYNCGTANQGRPIASTWSTGHIIKTCAF